MPDTNEVYDAKRCRICGCAWDGGIDDKGNPFGPHPDDSPCARYRPRMSLTVEADPVKVKIDDEAKARGELLGTKTTEWATRNGHAQEVRNHA